MIISGRVYWGSIFFLNDAATTEIYSLFLNEVLPIFGPFVIDDFSITLKNSDYGSPSGPILIYFLSFPSELKSTPYLYRIYSKIKTSHQTICKKRKKRYLRVPSLQAGFSSLSGIVGDIF